MAYTRRSRKTSSRRTGAARRRAPARYSRGGTRRAAPARARQQTVRVVIEQAPASGASGLEAAMQNVLLKNPRRARF